MSPVIFEEHQHLETGDIATIRICVTASSKRAVIVKDDDLLTKKEIRDNDKEVYQATLAEILTWIRTNCFKKCELSKARNVMTSRYVCKWNSVKVGDKWTELMRMRLALRGLMDLEAFGLDNFSGSARRTSQRILASEAACNTDFILASLDVDKAFLKGFAYTTGEKERTVCFKLPPGSASILRALPGYEDYDETRHCLQCVKPGTGTKDAPRAFSLKLRKTTKDVGLKSTQNLRYDPV